MKIIHPDNMPEHRFGVRLTEVPVEAGLPSPEEIENELLDMLNVLMGRADAPVDDLMALQEVASAYFARAAELEMMILSQERQQRVVRGSPLYKVRTGAIRSFMDACKKYVDLGSRRLTYEQMLREERYDAGEDPWR